MLTTKEVVSMQNRPINNSKEEQETKPKHRALQYFSKSGKRHKKMNNISCKKVNGEKSMAEAD
jgi:hypothetical protein